MAVRPDAVDDVMEALCVEEVREVVHAGERVEEARTQQERRLETFWGLGKPTGEACNTAPSAPQCARSQMHGDSGRSEAGGGARTDQPPEFVGNWDGHVVIKTDQGPRIRYLVKLDEKFVARSWKRRQQDAKRRATALPLVIGRWRQCGRQCRGTCTEISPEADGDILEDTFFEAKRTDTRDGRPVFMTRHTVLRALQIRTDFGTFGYTQGCAVRFGPEADDSRGPGDAGRCLLIR